jgi:hypothetical protein
MTSRGSPFFGLSVGGAPNALMSNTASIVPDTADVSREVWTLKVTKVGLLNRKDDAMEGWRKSSNRKWKQWSAILTGSQLLLFRDPSWAAALLAQIETPDGQPLLPQTAVFKPDEVLSMKDFVAVFDKSYTKVCL